MHRGLATPGEPLTVRDFGVQRGGGVWFRVKVMITKHWQKCLGLGCKVPSGHSPPAQSLVLSVVVVFSCRLQVQSLITWFWTGLVVTL